MFFWNKEVKKKKKDKGSLELKSCWVPKTNVKKLRHNCVISSNLGGVTDLSTGCSNRGNVSHDNSFQTRDSKKNIYYIYFPFISFWWILSIHDSKFHPGNHPILWWPPSQSGKSDPGTTQPAGAQTSPAVAARPPRRPPPGALARPTHRKHSALRPASLDLMLI